MLSHASATAGGLNDPTRQAPVVTAKETTSIGHLSWEITETTSGKILGKGSRSVKANEVQVISKDSGYLEQRIPLSDAFYVKLNAGRNEEPFIGFGMAAGKDDERTFCWEWFEVTAANRARKLQESGELEFQTERIGGFWEVVRTRFLSDVSMRVIEWSNRSGTDPTWRVRILKDSEIEWLTLAGGRVVLARDAIAWHVAHPPPPSFWSTLVRAAQQSTATIGRR